MVVLKGVPEEIPPEDLVTILRNQNERIHKAMTKDEDLKFRFKRANRNKNLYNAVLLAAPSVWRVITEVIKVNLDHQRVHAENYVPLLQCYHCLQFGHTKARCSQETPVCSHCATTGHSYQNCPSKKDSNKALCHNCDQHAKTTNSRINSKHSATSTTCPRVQLMSEKIQSRTDYGK